MLSLAGGALGVTDVSVYATASTIEVVTSDVDGETRETTIWIVVLEGVPYITTSGTTWGENVERDLRVIVRLADSTRPFDVLFVTGESERTKIHDAFREKYGFQDKLVSFFIDPAQSRIMKLVDSDGARR